MRRLLLLFPSQSYRVESFLAAADRAGVALWLGTDVPAASQRYGKPTLAVDFAHPEESARRIVESTASAPLSGIIATNESSAVVAALTSSLLGLPSSTADGARAARDKCLMRDLLASAGVPSPRHRILAPGDAPSALGDVKFPCVVKPPMLTGSQGVIRADTPDELARAVRRVRTILRNHGSALIDEPSFHHMVIEDYLPGREVSVEALMTDGELEPLAIFDKPDELVGPFFEETLYVTPSRLTLAEQADILDVTRRAARALGLTHGPIHAELRTHGGRSAIVEVAARSIGGLCSRVFQLIAGPLEDVLIAHAAGLPIPTLQRREGATSAGVMMMPVARNGVLKHVTGLDEARAQPGVESLTIALEPGDAIRALPEGASYLGFIFAQGPTPAAVERSLRDAFAALHFEWSPLLDVVL